MQFDPTTAQKPLLCWSCRQEAIETSREHKGLVLIVNGVCDNDECEVHTLAETRMLTRLQGE